MCFFLENDVHDLPKFYIYIWKTTDLFGIRKLYDNKMITKPAIYIYIFFEVRSSDLLLLTEGPVDGRTHFHLGDGNIDMASDRYQ